MYYLIYGFLYLISLLPLRVLYILSDGIYFLIYRVFGYRTKVVMQNLEIAFPEKSLADRKEIARKFYGNLIDTFFEMIKMLSATDAFFHKHFSGNWDVLNQLYSNGKPAHIHLGHTFNWEWGNYMTARESAYQFIGIYMPIKNKAMDRLFLKIRSRGGSLLVPATPPRAYIAGFHPHRNTRYVLGLIADQSPGSAAQAYLLNFFGRPTAFITGPEKGARARDLPVFFSHIRKLRRGYYHIEYSLAEEHPQRLPEGQLTVNFARYLENVIRQYPEMWLWSHRRWKLEWKEDYRAMWIGESINS